MKTFCPLFFPKRLFAGRTGPCAASGRGPSRPSDTASVRGAAGSRCGVFRSGPLRPPPANARRGRGATGGERTGTAAAGRHCRCGSGGETAARSENLRTRRPKRSVYWIVFCNFVRFLPVRAAGAVRCAAGRRPRTNNNTLDKRYG